MTVIPLSPKGNILVVDDTPNNLRLLSGMLREQGYEVRSVLNGRMALTTVEAEPPDLILLDITMPQMDGYEVCQQLKAKPNVSEIPVIFISALDDAVDKVKAFQSGGVDYITKPFQLEEVLARVENHLMIRSLQKELQQKSALLEAEIERAGVIQTNLLPKIHPPLTAFDLCAKCIPAKEVGGDFYDWYEPAPQQLSLTLGDVMGKGMAAALLMATVRASIRTTLNAFSGHSEAQATINCVSQALDADLLESEAFVTLFHLQLNVDTYGVEYVDAGHGHVFIHRVGGNIERLPVRNPPLGVGFTTYKAGSVLLQPGDALVIHSDGLIDARPESYENKDLIYQCIQQDTDAGTIVDNLVTFATSVGPLPDDLTVVVLRCKA